MITSVTSLAHSLEQNRRLHRQTTTCSNVFIQKLFTVKRRDNYIDIRYQNNRYNYLLLYLTETIE